MAAAQSLYGLEQEQMLEAVKRLVAGWDRARVGALSERRRWQLQGLLFRIADPVARASNLLEPGAAGRVRVAVSGGGEQAREDEVARRLPGEGGPVGPAGCEEAR